MGRKNEYDGLEEYLVVVKESGQREVQKSQEEIHRKKTEAGLLSNSFC